jgi:hypothetical protein
LLFLHAPLSVDMFVPRAFDIAEIAKGLFGGAEQFAATSPAALSLKYGGHNRRMGLTAVLPRLPPAGVFLSGLSDLVAKLGARPQCV